MDTDESAHLRIVARNGIIDAATALGLPLEDPNPKTTTRFRGSDDRPNISHNKVNKIGLFDIGDGAFEWRDVNQPTAVSRVRGRGGVSVVRPLTPLVMLPVEELGENALVAKLTDWDCRLNPVGLGKPLHRWDPDAGRLVPIGSVPTSVDEVAKPLGILLIIHGTFSLGQSIFDQLGDENNKAGNAFLRDAAATYEHILSFEHPTLSVSPVLNALDLTRIFDPVNSPVDVICHSRGGLVARWWLEAFGGAKRGGRKRVVFVASPLGGTSLASPTKLREAMNLFTTVGIHLRNALGLTSSVVPFLNVGTLLAQAAVMATGALAATPISDLFFSAIPGLGSMSRVGNQPELERLRNNTHELSSAYFAIRSDFRMEDAGWKFWKKFSRDGLSQWGADQIFSQANDLVVDNKSAIELFLKQDLDPSNYLDIARNGRVHHTNYFMDKEVLASIRHRLD